MIRRRLLHWTEFTDYPPGTPYAAEWNHYRRIVCRLLTEGHAGRWIVIKGDAIIGFWDTLAEAEAAGEVIKPVMLKRVLEWEPVIQFFPRVPIGLQSGHEHDT